MALKPGKFAFIENNDIRLSYEYAYKSVTTAGLWDLLKSVSQEEMFKRPEFTGLKMRKGSNWARTLQVIHQIAHRGWDTVARELAEKSKG